MPSQAHIILAVLGVISVFLARFAHGCAVGYAHDIADTMLFKRPIALWGQIGYALIALTAACSGLSGHIEYANHILVYTAAFCTVLLIIRAIQKRLTCPGCGLCWVLTFMMVFIKTIYLFPQLRSGQP